MRRAGWAPGAGVLEDVATLSCFRARLHAVSSRARVASLTSWGDSPGSPPRAIYPAPLAPKWSPAPSLRAATGLRAGPV